MLNRLDETGRVEARVLGARDVEPMTVDDVVVRTVGLLLVTGVAATVSWAVIPDAVWLGAALAGSALASIALVLVISLRQITNPVPIVGYAVLQGLLLGWRAAPSSRSIRASWCRRWPARSASSWAWRRCTGRG
ncbi:Bax inhibitor-1/YccA family protein [Micromonospora sp. M12]